MRPFLKVKKFVSISENVGNGLKIDSRYGEQSTVWYKRSSIFSEISLSAKRTYHNIVSIKAF